MNVSIQHVSSYLTSHLLDDGCDVTICFPPPPAVKKPSFFEQLWRKVVAFFRSIGKFLLFWKKDTPFALTARQVKQIQKAKDSPGTFVYRKNLTEAREPLHQEMQATFEQKISVKRSMKKVPKDAVLIEFCRCFKKFSEILLLQPVHEKIFTPQLPEWKKSALEFVAHTPQMVENLLNLKKAVAPFFEKFIDLQEPILTILGQQLLRVFTEPFNKEENSKELEKELFSRVTSLAEDGAITKGQKERILSLIPATVEWLRKSNNWLINSNRPVLIHHLFIDAIGFAECFSSLYKQGTYDSLLGEMYQLVETKFEKEFTNFLEQNVGIVAEHLSFRFCELLEEFPYQDVFNKMLDQVIAHIDAIASANKHYEEEKLLLKNAKNDRYLKTTSLEEVKKQRQAAEHIRKIEAFYKTEEDYLSDQILKSFCSSAACNPVVKRVLGSKTEKDAALIESDRYAEMAEAILTKLFPPVKASSPFQDGTEIYVSGMSEMFDQLLLSEKACRLKDLVSEMIETTLSHGSFNNKDFLQTYGFSLGKNLVVHMIHSKLKELLKQWIADLVHKVTTRIHLDGFLAETVLPLLIKTILASCARTVISQQAASFAPLFHKLYAVQDLDNTYALLTNKLYFCVKKSMKEFNMEEAGITQKSFAPLIAPLFTEITTNLFEELRKEDPLRKIAAAQIVTALEEYLKVKAAPPNQRYAAITLKALTVLGKLQLPQIEENKLLQILRINTEDVLNMLSSLITENASNAFFKLESSYHMCINSLIDMADKELLDADALRKLFFPEPLSEEGLREKRERTKVSLHKNILRISSLVHDVLFNALEHWGGSVFGTVLAEYATPKTPVLSQTFTRIFDNLLQYDYLNKSLLMQIVDVVGEGVVKADTILLEKQH